MPDLTELTNAVMTGNRTDATNLAKEAIDADLPAEQILDAMVAAMDEVGRRFQRNEMYVPEMLIAARAMKEAMAVLEPVLVEAGIKPLFSAVIGTVQGDLHDIGKNLVAMMWRGANIDVIDLGTNVTPDQFVAAAKKHDAKLIGLSALLTTTMPAMTLTVNAVQAAGLENARIMIGGAPITREFAEEIGADAFAPDAASAVDVARSLIQI